MRRAHGGAGGDGEGGGGDGINVGGGVQRGDARAAVGDGYADTERFLDDGPQVRQVLQDGEVVHGIRACGEGGGEF